MSIRRSSQAVVKRKVIGAPLGAIREPLSVDAPEGGAHITTAPEDEVPARRLVEFVHVTQAHKVAPPD